MQSPNADASLPGSAIDGVSLNTGRSPNESPEDYRQRLLFIAASRAARRAESYFLAQGGPNRPTYRECEDVALDLLTDWMQPDTGEQAFYKLAMLAPIRDAEFFIGNAVARLRLRTVRTLWASFNSSWPVSKFDPVPSDQGSEGEPDTTRREKRSTWRDRGAQLKVKGKDGKTRTYAGCPIADPPIISYVEPTMAPSQRERYCKRKGCGWVLAKHTGPGPAPEFCGKGTQCYSDRKAEDRKRQREARKGAS